MKRKINFSIVALAVLSMIVSMIFISAAYNKLYAKEVVRDLELIAGFLNEYDLLHESAVFNAEKAFDQEDIRVTLLDQEGNVLMDNAADVSKLDNYGDCPEIIAALKDGKGSAVRKSETVQKETYYFALKMESGDVLRVSREAEHINYYAKTIIPRLLLTMLILFAASLVIAHFLTDKLVKPIEEMAGNMDGNVRMTYYEELEPFILRIRQQHEDLVKGAKMRQEFTANVTHELKTPLTSISGYAELIETGLASGEDTVRFARGIHKNANRLLTLINDIIRLSELDASDEELVTEKLNLYELAKVCVEMLEPNAEKHHVTITMQGEECSIQGNRMMIEELLYNLCDNAIRYNNENGSVLVDVHREGENVVLSVSDTGIGIPKAYQERIFERFYRVDKSRSKSTGGTGLGLAIVKHILEKHGARLELDSDIGKGTRMKITFALIV